MFVFHAADAGYHGTLPGIFDLSISFLFGVFDARSHALFKSTCLVFFAYIILPGWLCIEH